jgi:hypothetical protein
MFAREEIAHDAAELFRRLANSLCSLVLLPSKKP